MQILVFRMTEQIRVEQLEPISHHAMVGRRTDLAADSSWSQRFIVASKSSLHTHETRLTFGTKKLYLASRIDIGGTSLIIHIAILDRIR